MPTTLEVPTCSSSVASTAVVRFHLSLNVRELDKSIEFFKALLGVEPAKCRPDYAKFEIDNPPLVLSLEPNAAPPGGNLNHLGFRMPDAAALVDVQRRLELAGISTVRETGVECCYARQTKFWVHDPDGNMWEVYTLDEDLEHRGDGHLPVVEPQRDADAPPAAIWNHRLGQPFPARLPIIDETVDLAPLQGTFNERLAAEEITRRLKEVHRVLKPGGQVTMHLLTADRPLGDAKLSLPGPAAAVQVAPTTDDVLSALASAGFIEPQITFLAKSPCFRVGEAELRETRMMARK